MAILYVLPVCSSYHMRRWRKGETSGEIRALERRIALLDTALKEHASGVAWNHSKKQPRNLEQLTGTRGKLSACDLGFFQPYNHRNRDAVLKRLAETSWLLQPSDADKVPGTVAVSRVALLHQTPARPARVRASTPATSRKPKP